MGTVTSMPLFRGMYVGGLQDRLTTDAGRPHPLTLDRPRLPITRTCPTPKPAEHTLDDRHFEDPERWDGMS
jgi:hypothetical protein